MFSTIFFHLLTQKSENCTVTEINIDTTHIGQENLYTDTYKLHHREGIPYLNTIILKVLGAASQSNISDLHLTFYAGILCV